MLCEKCKNKKPTVFFTDNGGINHALCAFCASSYTQGEQLAHEPPTPEIVYTPTSCLTSHTDIGVRIIIRGGAEKICEACKMSYADIEKSGLLGCSVCAEDILGMRQSSRRMPCRVQRKLSREKELEEFKATLSVLIANEDFEGAAAVRDKIRKIQNEL